MLQHTLDRVDRLAQLERNVTVIVRPHSWGMAAVRDQADWDDGRSAHELRYGARMSPFQLSPVKGA